MGRDSAALVWRILEGCEPLAVVWYADLRQREELVELIEAMAPPDVEVRRADRPDQMLGPGDDEAVVLLMPEDEVGAVTRLEVVRDLLSERRQPVLLFLLRGGAAAEALRDLPGLSSWLRGREIDPDHLDSVDVAAERERFTDETGQSPEAWLARWQTGDLPDIGENVLTYHRAWLLADPANQE